jgi:plastocyanin
MAAGATFSRTFDSPGEFRYICSLHPGMTGVVVVRR